MESLKSKAEYPSGIDSNQLSRLKFYLDQLSKEDLKDLTTDDVTRAAKYSVDLWILRGLIEDEHKEEIITLAHSYARFRLSMFEQESRELRNPATINQSVSEPQVRLSMESAEFAPIRRYIDCLSQRQRNLLSQGDIRKLAGVTNIHWRSLHESYKDAVADLVLTYAKDQTLTNWKQDSDETSTDEGSAAASANEGEAV